MNQPMLKEDDRPDGAPGSAAEDSAQQAAGSPAGGPGMSAISGDGLGFALMRLREARGMTRGEVSSRLKFSVRKIEALESEQWSKLPDGMSLRGFVKNYARLLGADSDALLQLLERQTGVPTPREAAVAQAASLTSDVPLHGETVSRPWGWLLIILILLLVAGFYAIERGWVPDGWLIFDWLKTLKHD
jgi:hypothetical protein